MDRLGYAPDLIVRRNFRNPKEISDEFREEQKQAETEKRKQLGEEHEAGERLKGMSAAKAERSVSAAKPANNDFPPKPEASECRKIPESVVR